MKIKDFLTDRIINLRHDRNFYEDRMQIAFKVVDTNEIFLLSAVDTSFFVDDIEFCLDSVDFENKTALVTKKIPELDPVTELLSIYRPSEESIDTVINKSPVIEPTSVEEAFNSFF